jgi:integrase
MLIKRGGLEFRSQMLWASRSVWHDRHVGIVEVAGSNPASSTSTPTLSILLKLKKQGYAEQTLEGISRRLRFLTENTEVTNPETVKEYIASQGNWGKAYKESMVNTYNHYVKFFGLTWNKPTYSRDERYPNVPTTEQANMIIAASGKKYSMIFSVLRDTGLRPIELNRLPLKHIDLENGTIRPETAKNGAPRILKLSTPTLAILKNYIAKTNLT